jgi:hypothetical protein
VELVFRDMEFETGKKLPDKFAYQVMDRDGNVVATFQSRATAENFVSMAHVSRR